MRPYNFGSSRHNLTKFYQGMWLIAGVITCTLILQGVPLQNLGVKNVQNSARFVTTFEFDRKYLWNGSTYRKSEKYFMNYISSPIVRKKFGELWSTNQKVMCAHVNPPNWTCLGDCFGPYRALAPQICTHPTSPINCISSRIWGAGRPQVGLCPYF